MRSQCKVFIIILFYLLCWSFKTFADPSIDASKKIQEDLGFDQSLSEKKSFENKLNEIKKKSETTTKSLDKATQESIKQMSQSLQNRSIDLEMPLQDPFLDIISRYEETGKKPFDLKILTKTPMLNDFGLTTEISSGVVDSIRSEIFQKAGTGNASLASVHANEKKLKQYINGIAFYGCLIAQSFLNIQNDLELIGIKIGKDHQNNVTANLAYDDLLLLAESAFNRALKDGFKGHIKALHDSIIKDRSRCIFAGSIDKIQCGRCLISFAGAPSLYAQGKNVYGESFAGLKGNFKVSSGSSWLKALETLKSRSDTVKLAQEITDSIESLMAQGKIKEAVLMSKVAWESFSDSSAGVATGKAPLN